MNSSFAYLPPQERKKIMLICDDIRVHSGVATVAKEIVLHTAQHFNWVNIGGAIKHPEQGKIIDVSDDTNTHNNITDANVKILPIDGYGTPELIRDLIKHEKPDALFFFTDPRYWIWLFNAEQEFRKKVPIIYLNIWDDLPYPMYNKSFYESCDALLAISKQTENINKCVLIELQKYKYVHEVTKNLSKDIRYSVYCPFTIKDYKEKFE